MKTFLTILAALISAAADATASTPASLRPNEVVAPTLNGDPTGSGRISGMIYFKNGTGAGFYGIDNTGDLRPVFDPAAMLV